MHKSILTQTAQAMVAPGKGILAADESTGTMTKRLESIHTPSTPENRQAFREMLFTTPNLGQHISGVILYDETLRQTARDGRSLAQVLIDQGVIPGIKVDTGAKPLAGFPGESVTEGLDGLRERLAEYKRLGAGFAKWRAVIAIGDGLPSPACIEANAHALARYAALCQEADIVPMVEPEVLMEGEHTLERCYAVTTAVLQRTYEELFRQNVMLEGTILKPNMVLPGSKCAQQASPEEIAAATVDCFLHTVPGAVPGITFLSGGQSPEEATTNLSAMNALGKFPWELSFSYGRALQQPVLQAWMGKAENIPAAQAALTKVAQANGAARYGTYRA